MTLSEARLLSFLVFCFLLESSSSSSSSEYESEPSLDSSSERELEESYELPDELLLLLDFRAFFLPLLSASKPAFLSEKSEICRPGKGLAPAVFASPCFAFNSAVSCLTCCAAFTLSLGLALVDLALPRVGDGEPDRLE